MGLDDTRFSLSNTPRVLGELAKAASRRFADAFAKPECALLVELGTHAPLAAAIAQRQGEGELHLAARCWHACPRGSLLLADRGFGNPAFLARLGNAALLTGQEPADFLVRVNQSPKVKVLELLADGCAWVELTASRTMADLPAAGKAQVVREVRARVRRAGQKWSEVRLWTSLLDAQAHPARELAALYARRWEWESFAREMIDLRAAGSALPLASHTLLTAPHRKWPPWSWTWPCWRAPAPRPPNAPRWRCSPSPSGARSTCSLRSGADLLSEIQVCALSERVLDQLSLAVLPQR